MREREELADDGEARARAEPHAERLPVHEPVALRLRERREHVHEADLAPEEGVPRERDVRAIGQKPTQKRHLTREPRVDRPHPRGGREGEEPREQTREVVVVQVRRDVDELDVREAEREERSGDTEEEARRHREAQREQHPEERVHLSAREARDPRKAPVVELVPRGHEQRVDPAIGEEALHRHAERETERDAIDREPRAVDGREHEALEPSEPRAHADGRRPRGKRGRGDVNRCHWRRSRGA